MHARFPGYFQSSNDFKFPEGDEGYPFISILGMLVRLAATEIRTLGELGMSWLHDIGLELQSPDNYMNCPSCRSAAVARWLLTISQSEYEILCDTATPLT